MKKQISMAALMQDIQRHSHPQKGIFTTADLCNVIGAGSKLKNLRTILRLVREGIIKKVQRGFYITEDAKLWQLSSRIQRQSYISMDSALAKYGIIGTIPEFSVNVVHWGRQKNIETPLGEIRYHFISSHLNFGYSWHSDLFNIADPEKAYLDLLYYYVKGEKFVVDPLSEVALRKINRVKVRMYLENYQNPKFVKFVRNLIDRK